MTVPSLRAPVSVATFLLLGAASLAACSGKTSANPDASTSGDGGPACTVVDAGALGDAAKPVGTTCNATVETPTLMFGEHIAIGAPLACHSNPPTSGPHYPRWAAFKSFDKVVPRGFYLHDAEHGAIVLLYKCAPADCAGIKSQLEQVAAGFPDDPLCKGTSSRVKILITQDPDLDTPIAAVAWGWAYKAQCVDSVSMLEFIREHYDKGPEQTCADGVSEF